MTGLDLRRAHLRPRRSRRHARGHPPRRPPRGHWSPAARRAKVVRGAAPPGSRRGRLHLKEALRHVTLEALEWSTVSPVVQRLLAAAETPQRRRAVRRVPGGAGRLQLLNKIAAGIADDVVYSGGGLGAGPAWAPMRVLVAHSTMHGSLLAILEKWSLQQLLGVQIDAASTGIQESTTCATSALMWVCRAVSRSSLKGRHPGPGRAPRPSPSTASPPHRQPFRQRILGIAIAANSTCEGAGDAPDHGDGAFPVPRVSSPLRVARTYDDLPGDGVRGDGTRVRGRRVLGGRRRLSPGRGHGGQDPQRAGSSSSPWCPQ